MSIARASNLILLLVTSLNELSQLSAMLKNENITNKRLFILNKVEAVPPEELKKFFKLPIMRISVKEKAGINDLRQKIFEEIGLIRVYTKEPGKKSKMERPMIIKKDSSVKDMAEKIRKDFPDRFIKARVWGSSAKFPGQTVGLDHILKDKDIMEIYLR